MKKDDLESEDDLLPEYDLKSLRVRKLGSGRKSFGSEVVRLELDVAEIVKKRESKKMNANTVEQRLIEKICKLSSTRIVEIENFIDFLSQREEQSDGNLTLAASKLSEAAFAKVWNNPEDAAYDDL